LQGGPGKQRTRYWRLSHQATAAHKPSKSDANPFDKEHGPREDDEEKNAKLTRESKEGKDRKEIAIATEQAWYRKSQKSEARPVKRTEPSKNTSQQKNESLDHDKTADQTKSWGPAKTRSLRLAALQRPRGVHWGQSREGKKKTQEEFLSQDPNGTRKSGNHANPSLRTRLDS